MASHEMRTVRLLKASPSAQNAKRPCTRVEPRIRRDSNMRTTIRFRISTLGAICFLSAACGASSHEGASTPTAVSTPARGPSSCETNADCILVIDPHCSEYAQGDPCDACISPNVAMSRADFAAAREELSRTCPPVRPGQMPRASHYPNPGPLPDGVLCAEPAPEYDCPPCVEHYDRAVCEDHVCVARTDT